MDGFFIFLGILAIFAVLGAMLDDNNLDEKEGNVTKKSLKENFEEVFPTDDAFEKTLIKIEDEKVDGLVLSRVMIKGLLPNVSIFNA